MRLAVRRRDLQRLLRRGHRFRHRGSARMIQVGQLRRQSRPPRIERHRALVRRDRAVDVVVVFEPVRQQELCRTPRPRGPADAQGPAAGASALAPQSTRPPSAESNARRTASLHRVELFHKSGEVSYSPRMAVDPELLEILACPNCKTPVTLVKNGTALKCAHVQPRLPHQGRHPGDAHRRGHHRRLNCRWQIAIRKLQTFIDLALIAIAFCWSACGEIGDVVFTTPAVRALRQRFPESAHQLSRRAGRGADRRGTTRTSTRSSSRRAAAACAGSRAEAALGPPAAARRRSISRSISTAGRARRC